MGTRNLEFARSLPLFVWSQVIRHQDLIVWESLVHFSDVNAAHIIRDHLINCGSGTGCIPLPIQSRLTCFLGPILVEVLQRQNIVLRTGAHQIWWAPVLRLYVFKWQSEISYYYFDVDVYVIPISVCLFCISIVRMTSLTISWLTPVGKFIETTHAPADWPWEEIRFETTFFVYFTFMTQCTKSHCLLLIRNAEKRLIRYYFLAAYLKFPYFKNGTFSTDT